MTYNRRIDAVLNWLWIHALAKAGGDPRRFDFSTWPETYKPRARA